MPGRNRTGPHGAGPRTGWGWGDCRGPEDVGPPGGGRGWDRRGGGGFRWRHRFWATGEPAWWRRGHRWDDAEPASEVASLRVHQHELERELAEVRERLAALEPRGDSTPRGGG